MNLGSEALFPPLRSALPPRPPSQLQRAESTKMYKSASQRTATDVQLSGKVDESCLKGAFGQIFCNRRDLLMQILHLRSSFEENTTSDLSYVTCSHLYDDKLSKKIIQDMINDTFCDKSWCRVGYV